MTDKRQIFLYQRNGRNPGEVRTKNSMVDPHTCKNVQLHTHTHKRKIQLCAFDSSSHGNTEAYSVGMDTEETASHTLPTRKQRGSAAWNRWLRQQAALLMEKYWFCNYSADTATAEWRHGHPGPYNRGPNNTRASAYSRAGDQCWLSS